MHERLGRFGSPPATEFGIVFKPGLQPDGPPGGGYWAPEPLGGIPGDNVPRRLAAAEDLSVPAS